MALRSDVVCMLTKYGDWEPTVPSQYEYNTQLARAVRSSLLVSNLTVQQGRRGEKVRHEILLEETDSKDKQKGKIF